MRYEDGKYPLPQNLLEKKLGYTFKDPSLLQSALYHSSYANELKSKGVTVQCNERLEFFGDSVLSLIVSDYLYFRYVANQEGDMTKIRAAVEAAPGYEAGKPVIVTASNLTEAAEAARAHAVEGDVVTLSPACASFDQFPNFMARGKAFKAIVNGWQ